MGQLGTVATQGLWSKNPIWVQLLGLCPLMAVSSSVVNALGLSLATLAVLSGSNLSVSLVRSLVAEHLRIPVFILIIASFTTIMMLLMQSFTFELYLRMALFVQIIVTNCIILGRAETFARHNRPLLALWDGLMVGAGFSFALLVLGGVREILSRGTLMSGMELLLGPPAAQWVVQVSPFDFNVLLAALPPGAFIVAGLLLALKNAFAPGVAPAIAEDTD